MRRRLSLVATLLAVGLVAGCAKPLPLATGTARTDAVAAQAVEEAANELATGGSRPLSAGESGLTRAEFTLADADRDGRLSSSEQVATFRRIWEGVQAIARAKAQPAEALAKSPIETTKYAVPHSMKLQPSQAEVFVDAAEILPAVYQTIQSAQRSVWIDVFLLGGAEGLKLADLLVAKMKEGVDVRVIHDPGLGLGGTTQEQVLKAVRHLQAQAVPVKLYPVRYLKHRRGNPWANKFMIDHNKFIVVDEHTAMIGTMNLIDLGTMNHDVYVRLDGEPARELAAIHAATWALDTPKMPDLRRNTPPSAPRPLPESTRSVQQALGETGLARVTKTDIDQRTTKAALMEQIKTAKRSIHVAIYDYSDMEVTKALIEAYKRGVDVKVLSDKHTYFAKYVPSLESVKIYGIPNLLPKNALRDAGVPVKWYVPQVADQELHMKVALFDGERAIVGSTNFTYQAFENFRETGVDIVGGAVPHRLEQMFKHDWETKAEPVLKPTFKEKCFMTATKYMDKFNLSWW